MLLWLDIFVQVWRIKDEPKYSEDNLDNVEQECDDVLSTTVENILFKP